MPPWQRSSATRTRRNTSTSRFRPTPPPKRRQRPRNPEAASPPQWVPPQGTAERRPYGYGYWTPDQLTYDALFGHDFAGTQPAPHGYQEDATARPERQHDAYGYEAWAAAPYDTSTHGAWGPEQWTAGPVLTPVDGEPSLHTPAAPPAPLPHREDKNARQPARAAQPKYTAPPRARAGALPTLALLVVLLGARLV